ncbi:MAG: APC family permease [Bacteroidetes bacterium]|nr:APC family permease [Bacteroidota bacterium]
MKQTLTRFDLTMIVISLVIGMGIFRTPASVANDAGNQLIFFAAWIFAGMVSLFGALTFAEIGSRYPCHGGFYNIMAITFNPATAFSINWATLISNAASTAAVALAGSEYLFAVFIKNTSEMSDIYKKLFCIVIILILFSVNWLGLRMSATMQNILMLLKIAMILLVIISPFFINDTHPILDSHTSFKSFSLLAFSMCFKSVFFTYGGYQQTVNFGADIKDGNKNIPKAIIGGFLIILILYITINISYIRSLGFSSLAATKTPGALIIQQMLGQKAGIAFSLLMFFCVMGYVNVCMLSNPRVYYAMAQETLMPSSFAKTHEKTQVPRASLLLFTGLIILTLFLSTEFDKIVNVIMFFDSISFIALVSSIFYLRRKNISLLSEKPYKIKGYPYIPIFS